MKENLMAKKKFGDRKDARRVPVTALMQCAIDLKPGRLENDVYINRKIDVTALREYMEKKNAGGERYTYFHAFVTAIGKVIYNRPKLNRFVANRHLYEHNEVTVSFVAKMAFDDKSEELMMIVPIGPDSTMNDVKGIIDKKLANIRSSRADEEKAGAHSAIDILGKLPNIIRVPIMGAFKAMDKRGWLPSALTGDLIYYSSTIISNMGSIGCGAIYHNLANFGTASSLITMGEIVSENVLGDDGTWQKRYFCEFGITLDERIRDGYYYAKSAKYIEYLMAHPELLDEPAGEKIEIK